MKINPESLLETIVYYEVKKIGYQELSNWAAELLEIGIETKSIVLIAGLTESESQEAITLLHKAILELGFCYPSEEIISIAHAKMIAKDILNGSIPPNEGCAKIGDINHYLDWPDSLSTFGMLSHEQTGHENIGITKESVVPEIISAAKDLVSLKISLEKQPIG